MGRRFENSNIMLYVNYMADHLHSLLEQDEPTDLARIERALSAQDELSADQEAVLSTLVWRRCTTGAAGLLGAVLHHDCARRIGDMPEHLETIGAPETAEAIRELCDAIPLDEDRISRGLADWIETESDIVTKAQELDAELDDIDQTIWNFMKNPASDIPDVELPTRSAALLSSIRRLFGSDTNDAA